MIICYDKQKIARDKLKDFLIACHNSYSYLFDLSILDSWVDKIFQNAYCICEIDGDTICSACFFYTNREEDFAFITLIARLPGISTTPGHVLIRECIEQVKRSGVSTIKLEVLRTNMKAKNFYLRQGFQIDEMRTNSDIMKLTIVK